MSTSCLYVLPAQNNHRISFYWKLSNAISRTFQIYFQASQGHFFHYFSSQNSTQTERTAIPPGSSPVWAASCLCSHISLPFHVDHLSFNLLVAASLLTHFPRPVSCHIKHKNFYSCLYFSSYYPFAFFLLILLIAFIAISYYNIWEYSIVKGINIYKVPGINYWLYENSVTY